MKMTTTTGKSIKVQLVKCVNFIRRGEFEKCSASFDKLKLYAKENGTLHEQYIVQNNCLVCKGLACLKMGHNADYSEDITEAFNKLLCKISDSLLEEEEHLALHLVAASNFISWNFFGSDVTASSIEKCVKVWELCLQKTNLFLKSKTKNRWKHHKGLSPELFTQLNEYTCCCLFFCACIMALLYFIHMDYTKGRHILASLANINLKESSESEGFLSFLTVDGLTGGSSCAQLNAMCEDLFRLISAILDFLEKDFERSADHLHNILTTEWTASCSYLAAFAEYQVGKDFSKVTRLLQDALTFDESMLDSCLKARIYNLLGCMLAKENKPFMALEHFKQAITADDSFLTPLYNISLQYRKMELPDAELESLELLCKQLKSKSSVLTSRYTQKNLMLYPVLQIVNIFNDDLHYLPVCLMLARRCMHLKRFDVASEKYLALLSAIIQTPALKAASITCELPCMQHVYHETALALLKCGSYRDALTVCQKAIDAYVQYASTSRTAVIQASSSQGSTSSNHTVLAQQALDKHNDCLASRQKSAISGKEEALKPPSRKRSKSESESGCASTTAAVSNDELDYLSDDVLALTVKAHAHLRLDEGEEALVATNRILSCLSETRNRSLSDDSVVPEPHSKKPRLELEVLVSSAESLVKIKLPQLKAHIHSLKAVIQSQRDCLEDAFHNLRLSLQLAPDDMSVWYNYALLMVKMRRHDEGLRSWLRFRQKDQTDETSTLSNHLFAADINEDDLLKLDSLAKKHTLQR